MKENFQPNNIEPKKEDISHEKRLNLAKHARRILLATGVAMSALFPNKTEAQKVKEREPIFVGSRTDPRLKAYRDSLDIYNLSKKVNRNPLKYPEISKHKYDSLKYEADKYPEYLFDQEKYDRDKKQNKVEDFKDYVYSIPSFKGKNYKNYLDSLRKNNEAYARNYPEKDETPDKEVTLKNGVIRSYQTYKGEVIDENLYSDFDPETGVTRTYYDGVLDYIHSPHIKPIKEEYFGKNKIEEVGSIDLSSAETGWYNSIIGKPKFKTTSKDHYPNYQAPITRYNVYQKPLQPIVYKKGAPITEKKFTNKIEEKGPEAKTALGTFNIQGREVSYYSEEQKNSILTILKDHDIVATQVGDSDNYTVSRFNEKTDGWDGNELKFKDGGSVVF